jgi:hypothetical protein
LYSKEETGVQVLVIQTDGGPDRNNQFVAVQLAYLALAVKLGCKLLILKRTAPGQSYVNPVERVMSVVNLSLYGLALERGLCREETEDLIKGCNSMKTRRKAIWRADAANAAYAALREEVADVPAADADSNAASSAAPAPALGASAVSTVAVGAGASGARPAEQSMQAAEEAVSTLPAHGAASAAAQRSHAEEFQAAMQRPIDVVANAARVRTFLHCDQSAGLA